MQWLVAVLALALLIGWTGISSAEEAPPSAETILAKYIEAVGGEEALAKIKNRVTKARMNMSSFGIEGIITSYVAPPGKSYTEVALGALGKSLGGTNDGVAWEINPIMGGARLLEGPEKEQRLRQACLDQFFEWKKNYVKAETDGEETVGKAPCYKVVLTPKEGAPMTCLFDKETGLAAKTVYKLPDGSEISVVLSDYRPVDGVKVPFKSEGDMAMLAFDITLESVEQNVELPPGRFDLPPEVKQLVDVQKKQDVP